MAVVSLVEMQLELPSWVKLPVILSALGESDDGLDVAVELVLEAVLGAVVVGAAELASIADHASTVVQDELVLRLVVPLEVLAVIFEHFAPVFGAEEEEE